MAAKSLKYGIYIYNTFENFQQDSFLIFWLSMPDSFRIPPKCMLHRRFQIFLGQIFNPGLMLEPHHGTIGGCVDWAWDWISQIQTLPCQTIELVFLY